MTTKPSEASILRWFPPVWHAVCPCLDYVGVFVCVGIAVSVSQSRAAREKREKRQDSPTAKQKTANKQTADSKTQTRAAYQRARLTLSTKCWLWTGPRFPRSDSPEKSTSTIDFFKIRTEHGRPALSGRNLSSFCSFSFHIVLFGTIPSNQRSSSHRSNILQKT